MDTIPVVDDLVGTPKDCSLRASTPTVAPLSPARVPDHSKTFVPRHGGSSAATITESTLSPPSERRSDLDLTIIPGIERSSLRLASGFFAFFCCGWSDGVTATVLPHFMREFNISFMTSSLLYAASTVGFISGTFLLESILQQLGRIHPYKTKRFGYPYYSTFSPKQARPVCAQHSPSQGRHLALMLSSAMFTFYFVIMGARKGYPSLLVAYCLTAFSRSIMSGLLNPYFASIDPMYLSFAHALWSFGTVLAPLVCQTIIAEGVPWPYFYFGSLILAGINIVSLTLAFIPTVSAIDSERKKANSDSIPSSSLLLPRPTKETLNPISKPAKPPNTLRIVISHPLQWLACLFALLYAGTETSSQAFIVTFILGHRKGNPKTAGYVPAGFFAGIMVGRIAWGASSRIINFKKRRMAIFACLTTALIMQLLIWFIDSVVANAVSLVIIGMMFGPMFPAAMNMLNDVLPLEQRLVSLALLSSGGSLGNAILPFTAGIILNAEGVKALPYWNVLLTALVICVWFCLPSSPPQAGSRWLSRKYII